MCELEGSNNVRGWLVEWVGVGNKKEKSKKLSFFFLIINWKFMVGLFNDEDEYFKFI